MGDNEYSYEFDGFGLGAGEKRIAKASFEEYCKKYPHLNNITSYSMLEEVVFLESVQRQVKQKISKLLKDKNSNGAIPDGLRRQLNENTDQILKLKEKLGLFEKKEKLDAFNDFQKGHKKFKKWCEENMGSRKVTCPHCSEIFFLYLRTDKFEEKKVPFFKDKVLCNPYLHALWEEERITKEEYAEILGVSPDYVLWIHEKHFQKLKKLDPQ